MQKHSPEGSEERRKKTGAGLLIPEPDPFLAAPSHSAHPRSPKDVPPAQRTGGCHSAAGIPT